MSGIIQRPKRISSETVDKEQRQAVDTVGSSVNTFMEEVYITIMGNAGVTSNLNMEFKTITVEVDASGIPKQKIAFKSNLKTKVIGTTVIRAFISIPITQPFISFAENSGIVSITHIAGLAPDTKYQLVILSIGS